MLTALSTGHDGSLCTVHAGTPAEALRRLETLALMADVGLPHAAIREQVADAIDLVVCQARAADGTPPGDRRSPRSCASPAAPAAREIYALRDGRATLARAAGSDGRWRRGCRCGTGGRRDLSSGRASAGSERGH